ncbi:MAG: hypothetical protein H7319_05415 [Spirosoma sp.]|nr:hypothetical protein [Spirosoma sp.]
MRYLRYFIISVALVFWLGGLSGTASHWLYDTGVIADDYRNGDLYRMSALPQFREPAPTCPPANRDADTAQTHLYILGDSFSEEQRLSQDDFRVSYYRRAKWDTPPVRVQLDPAKRNVLLMETIERHVRGHFSKSVREVTVVKDTVQNPAPVLTAWQRIKEDIHWSDVEERLASALFSQRWAFWFKEIKARLTLDWFNRASVNVSLSEDKEHIFLNSDTDSATPLSSFSELSDREVSALVDSVNATADYYKRLGFDEVYLSIIPNKVTIVEPDRGMYNQLIPRIQNNPNLRVPTVNVYDPYKKATVSPYLTGDTHWTCAGRATWLQLVWEKAGI